MSVTKYYDTPNGLVYNAIGTAAWAGAEGVQLRAEGWTYCGFGTGGIYIAPPGGECSTKADSPTPGQPDILPPAPPPSQVTDSATQGGCGCSSTPASAPTAGAGAITPPITEAPHTPAVIKKAGCKTCFPWWLWVLIFLTVAKVTHGRDA